MALYKPIRIDGDEDIKVLMKKLYRFNEDLRFTMSNLDLADNCPGILEKIDELITETLNPSDGIFAANLEVYNDEEYVIYITDTINAGEAYISGELNCRQVRQRSDRRVKKNITGLNQSKCAKIVSQLQPKSFRFIDSGIPSIGFEAQDVYRIQDDLPLVGRNGAYLEIPYGNCTALLAGAIQDNQRRIDRLKRMVM